MDDFENAGLKYKKKLIDKFKDYLSKELKLDSELATPVKNNDIEYRTPCEEKINKHEFEIFKILKKYNSTKQKNVREDTKQLDSHFIIEKNNDIKDDITKHYGEKYFAILKNIDLFISDCILKHNLALSLIKSEENDFLSEIVEGILKKISINADINDANLYMSWKKLLAVVKIIENTNPDADIWGEFADYHKIFADVSGSENIYNFPKAKILSLYDDLDGLLHETSKQISEINDFIV